MQTSVVKYHGDFPHHDGFDLNSVRININENNAYAPLTSWDKINELGWYWKAKKDSANDDIAAELLSRYQDVNDIVVLQNFVVEARTYLEGLLTGYFKNSPQEIREEMDLTNDEMWDLCSHIVGLGDVMYYYVVDHPDIVLTLKNDVRENFEYGFDKAIYELQYAKTDAE